MTPVLDHAAAAPGDATLVARACDGDVDAFRRLYERHVGAVRGYALGRVGPAVADDVVSETFLEAWTARSRFRPDAASARPWLYGIATNVVARHREHEERWIESRGAARATSGVETPEPTAYELDPDLARAIGRLAPAQRDVLLLTALADLRITDAARALGISTVAARVRLHRARSIVAAALEETEHD